MNINIWDSLALHISRLGPTGLAPIAAGTWGSAVAIILAPICFLPLSLPARILVLTLLFIIGCISAGHTEYLLGQKDSGQIVIDEFVGMWLVLLPFDKPTLSLLIVAFILFRIFDIFKPWPINASEVWFSSGFGIMIDDILAAFFAIAWIFIFKLMGIL